jgi:uncharacterized membrane protein YcjF (UPF0283 family)
VAVTLNPWTRCYVLAICCLVLWLAAIAPTGKIGKGLFLILGLASSIQLIQESQALIFDEAMQRATEAMHQELAQTGLVLETYQQEQEMQKLYLGDTSAPEVKQELMQALEALYQENVTTATEETSTSVSEKSLYLAVVELMGLGASPTFIIEKVLHRGGRNFDEGKQMLDELLRKGRENEW